MDGNPVTPDAERLSPAPGLLRDPGAGDAWLTEFAFPSGVPDDGRCMTFRDFTTASRCPDAAVCVALAGCVSEYLRLNRYCAPHLTSLRAGLQSCRRCWQRSAGEEENHPVQLIRLRMDA